MSNSVIGSVYTAQPLVSTEGAGAPAAPDGFSFLTGDALLTYCETRLTSLDSEIKSRMDDQKAQLKSRAVLDETHSAMKKFDSTGISNADQAHQAIATLEAEKAKVSTDDPAYAVLDKMENDIKNATQVDQMVPVTPMSPLGNPFIGSGIHDYVAHSAPVTPPEVPKEFKPIAKEDWTAYEQPLDDASKQVASAQELQMIELQQFMSQRQTAVQLTTDMMSKLDQTTEAIVQKM